MQAWHGDSRADESAPSLMSGAAPGSKPAGGVLGRLFGRRRVVLLDAGYQVRTALVAVLGMAFLLAFAAALLHLLSQENARLLAQKIPGPGRSAGGDARSVLYLVAAGIIFVAAVFVVEILETHKTAGVILKVTRGLQEIEAGRWGARIVLRKHDNFKEMEEAFNAAARSLRDRVEEDLSALQAVEGQLRLLSREVEGGNHEGALVLLRQVASELQNQRERRRDMLRSREILAGRHKT